MSRGLTVLIVAIACLAMPAVASAVSDEALFRVFLTDGTSIVSYGELARVNDQVVLSMPAGGTDEAPRLHTITLAAAQIDWARTDRYAESARYQRYVATRAEADYARLTDEVALVLSSIAQTTDRTRALAIAEQARTALAAWPRTHFGYRQQDLLEIVGLIDGAIARLEGRNPKSFDIALVLPPERTVETLATLPSPREQVDQLLHVAELTSIASDRVALYRSALTMMSAPGFTLDKEAGKLRRSIEQRIRKEDEIDQRYARASEKIVARARRGAAAANLSDVQRVLDGIGKEDKHLGAKRPAVVQALTTTVQAQLEEARHLRLLQDQWQVRQSTLRSYQKNVSAEIGQLVKAQSELEAIRKLDGPAPARLSALRVRLKGGAERLARLQVPDYLQPAHEMLVGAFRFAESAANTRYDAVTSGNLSTAWQASSAAAGSLMMLSRAQQEIRALLQPPKLQ